MAEPIDIQTSKAIKERIKPVGQVYIADTDKTLKNHNSTATPAATSTVTKAEDQTTSKTDGAAIYKQYCAACHNSGAAGAPKLGDTMAWKERLKKGELKLIENALKGYKIMPPKGTCTSCSNQDIANAVKYMLSKSS